MSSSSAPITAARFAAALPDLPLSSLYAKTAELRNSIQHLKQSNDELESYASEGDAVCADAIKENLEVIENMEERIELLKTEVEARGSMWDDPKYDQRLNGAHSTTIEVNNNDTYTSADVQPDAEANEQPAAVSDGGARRMLGDEELARLLRERMEDRDDDGVHL